MGLHQRVWGPSDYFRIDPSMISGCEMRDHSSGTFSTTDAVNIRGVLFAEIVSITVHGPQGWRSR